MIEDPDVIFVDFDELFDAKALDSAFGNGRSSQLMHNQQYSNGYNLSSGEHALSRKLS